MIRQGTSVKAVQKQLGHATASITLDTYGHLFPDELDVLADRLEDARTDALATLARTRHGPQVVPIEKPQVSGLVEGCRRGDWHTTPTRVHHVTGAVGPHFAEQLIDKSICSADQHSQRR
jgi:hypothetical protein